MRKNSDVEQRPLTTDVDHETGTEVLSRQQASGKRQLAEIAAEAHSLLTSLPSEPAANSAELRSRVLDLVKLLRASRQLGISHVAKLLPQRSASERILAYLRLFVGTNITGAELAVVSGISEYARRVREWRVEFGWPILHNKKAYVLERDEPDDSKAELWRLVNRIRRSEKPAIEKMLDLFLGLPVGTVITTPQLRYVTEGKDMRRVRELRTQMGWRIMTNRTGMPQLKPGQYVLIDPQPAEEHDRHIEPGDMAAVLVRDKQMCRKCGWHPKDRVPGDPRQYIEVHHVTWHAEGGENKAENLVSLCNVHHKEVHKLGLKQADLPGWLKS